MSGMRKVTSLKFTYIKMTIGEYYEQCQINKFTT